jgi:amino acid transporter
MQIPPLSSSVPYTASVAPAKSQLGMWGVVMVIYFIVAGGPFGLEGLVSASAPGMSIVLVLVTPLLWSLPIMLVTLELGTAMPVEGGYYAWVKRALGPFWGFIEGWTSWLYGILVTSSFAVLFADYLSAFLKQAFGVTLLEDSQLIHWLTAVAMTALFAWINIRGAKSVGESAKLFAFFVLLPFVVMFGLAIARYFAHPTAFWLPFAPPGETPSAAFSLGLFVVMYNYLGWDGISTVLEEVKEPLKVVPRAMGFAMILVVLGYLLPLISGLIGGYDWTKWEAGAWADIAARLGGQWLSIWVAFGGLFSAAGLFAALLFSTSRLPFVLANDHFLPAFMTAPHRKFGTPWVAILISSVLFIILETGKFDSLLVASVVMYGVALLLEYAALIALRITQPKMRRPFRIPLGWFGVIVAAAVPAIILVMASVKSFQDPDAGGWAFLAPLLGLLATGPVAYVLGNTFIKRGRPSVEVPIIIDP